MPGYSKLLINDWVIPENNPTPLMTSMDLNMMSFGGDEERTKARHEDYIAKAGFKINGIFDPEDGVSEAIIECELA